MPPFDYHTEEGLIDALVNKRQEAFNYLYDNYGGSLYGVIVKIVGEENEEAQDVLQETFVKIWHYIDRYDAQKGRLYTWMLNIARNTAIDKVRSVAFQQQKEQINLENITSESMPSALSNTFPVDHLGLDKVTALLEEKYKLLIDLCYFKGYTQEEIAQTLNIPLGTIKTRLRKALIQLKEFMK